MFDITLIAMGKLKEKFYLSACEEYTKRLGGYCKFNLIELPEVRLSDEPSPAEICAALDKEFEQITAKIPMVAPTAMEIPMVNAPRSEPFLRFSRVMGSVTPWNRKGLPAKGLY